MKLRLDNCRLSFADLFTPKAKFGGDEKFSACLLVDKSTPQGEANMKKFKEICRKLEAESFDGKELGLEKLCVSDGNSKDYAGWQDMIVFSAANKKRPIIIGKQKQAVVEGDADAPYSGCYVNVILDVWPLTGQFGPRIVASLEAVQFCGDGEAFVASNVNIDSDFDTVEDTKTADTLGL